MAETRPTPDKPKPRSEVTRVLFPQGTSFESMVDRLVELRAKAGKPGKDPPKASKE